VTHFFKIFLHKGKKKFQKNAIYCIWFDAARRADSESQLGFAPKWYQVSKNRDLEAKTSVFERLIESVVLISAKWRYSQRWTRHGRILSESLRLIGPKFFWGFTKYGKTGFQKLVGHRNQLFFRETLTVIYDSMPIDELILNITLV
jgi:hypothetical protein